MCIKNNIFKSNSEENILKSNSIKLIYNNSEENTKNRIFISPMFILLIMIIMVLQEILEDIFYKSNLRALDFWMFELPLLSYLNLKYFKFKIYLHHKLVIYLNLIICSIYQIIALVVLINNYNDKEGDKEAVFKYYKHWGVIPLGIITYLIIMISRAFAINEIKALMQYKYLSPIKLLIIYGIIGAIITIIIGTISSFIECNKINSSLDLKICKITYNTNKNDNINKTYFLENFKIWKDEIDIGGIILLIIGIITNFFYRLFYILLIKYLTAIHIIFSNLIYSYFLLWIGNIVFIVNNKESNDNDNNNNNKSNFIIFIFNIIMQIFVIFGFLIYFEMIELDFCKLNYNLKKEIINRSIEDYELKSNNEEDYDINFNNNNNINDN